MQPDGSWAVVRGFNASNTYTWTGTSGAGLYRAEVDVKQQGSPVTYDAYGSMYYSLSGCTGASLSTDKPSPGPQGATITLRGVATCPASPDYRFWVAQNGTWRVVQDYSPTSTYAWNTSALPAGTYGLEVDVRNHGSTVSYDRYSYFYYTLAGCSSATLHTSLPSPESPGSTVVLMGGASCPGTPEFRFWVGYNGTWRIAQDYSTSDNFSWNTTGLSGTYGLEVDVRDQGSTVAYDKVANVSFTVANVPCATPSLGGSPSGSSASGSTPVFTASTSGCASPNYRFWVGQNGTWTIKQDYSATSTFSWNTTGYAAAAYSVEVDVRDASSSAAYDHVANFTYTLSGCSSAHLATDKASPQVPGTTIVLAGSATCPGTPTYRFLVGGTVVQDYSTTSTYSWSSR
jgi:hypothetical protein